MCVCNTNVARLCLKKVRPLALTSHVTSVDWSLLSLQSAVILNRSFFKLINQVCSLFFSGSSKDSSITCIIAFISILINVLLTIEAHVTNLEKLYIENLLAMLHPLFTSGFHAHYYNPPAKHNMCL